MLYHQRRSSSSNVAAIVAPVRRDERGRSFTNHQIQILELFEQLLGLVVSHDWFDRCYTALQEQQQPLYQQNSTITADRILEQLIYHDLRDVVRNETTVNNNNNIDTVVSTNAILLRNAITKTQQQQQLQQQQNTATTNGENYKCTMPSTFRCCVQIEEVCDVAQNSETRLTATTTTTTNNIGTYTTSSSCHKVCMTDGYSPEQAIVAIEVSPISPPGLTNPTTQQQQRRLLPGTKVVLFGPNITIRNGILGLHSGNCIVLGGHVDRLVQIQNQALQRMKEVSGHGIDPTIRALIWSNQRQTDTNLEDADLNNDEGTVKIKILSATFLKSFSSHKYFGQCMFFAYVHLYHR
jgi:RecQ mediated genome instability protein